jgi:hypothetical protein
VYVPVRIEARGAWLLRMLLIPIDREGGPVVVEKTWDWGAVGGWNYDDHYPPAVVLSHPELGVIVAEVRFPKNRRFWWRAGSRWRHLRIWFVGKEYWEDYLKAFLVVR